MSDLTAVDTTVALRSPLEEIKLADLPAIATLRDAGPLRRFVIRGADVAATGLAGAMGVVPPHEINRAAITGSRAVLKLGPDEWLFLAEVSGALQLEVPPGARLSVVDIGHRNTGLRLSGAKIETMLAAGCPLPLDPVAFPVGRATRTLYAKAEIVLWRMAVASFHIEVARSYAPYLAAHLGEAIEVEAALGMREKP